MHRGFSGLLLVIIAAMANRADAQVWSQMGAPVGSWQAVATSADGIKLAGASSTKLYTSSNSGKNWTWQTSAPAKTWTALASSADGSVLLAVASGASYTSTNFGTNWQSNTIPGSSGTSWDTAAMSADGNTLIFGGQIFSPVCYSTNRGGTWRTNGVPTGYWTSVVCSADGSKFAAAWSGVIYVSTNSGTTWTNYNTSGGSLLACSSDGGRLLMCTPGFNFSTNWGATFTSRTPPSSSSTLLFGASADANRLVAIQNGSLYLSTDLGVSWTTNYAPAQTWKAMALCPSGAELFAAVANPGGMFAWVPPALSVTNAAGNLLLSWSTNGTPFGLQVNTDLTSTNWAAVTNTPTFTNSKQQVTMPQTNAAGFFRLISQ